jgi:hypothetical protein
MNTSNKEYIIHKLIDGTYSNTFTGGDLQNPLTISANSETALEVGPLKVDTTNNKVCITDGTEGIGKILQSDASGCGSWVLASGFGEVNTASNQGTLGVGVFKQKTGADLEFNNIEGGVGITETLDANNNILIDLDDTAVIPSTYGDNNSVSQVSIDQQGRITSASNVDIDHDALLNFVSNEHIDHSNVSLINGTGISAVGLGDLTASRTINVDPSGIDHDALLNFVSNEHIDWTNATSAFITSLDSDVAFRVRDSLNNNVLLVNTNNDIVRVDGKYLQEGDFGEALLCRKTGDVKDIFKVNTSGEIISSTARVEIQDNNTIAFRVANESDVNQFVVDTTTPRVDVIAPLQYTGSTPGDGYLLRSDASGNATWQMDRMADIYWEGNTTATDIVTTGVYVKVSVAATLTTLNAFAMGGWDLNGVENRLRYTGLTGGFIHLGATFSVDGGNGQEYESYLGKNGTKIPGSLVEFATSNATSFTSTAIHCITNVATNDYFELFITNRISTNNDPIVTSANIFAVVMG